MTNLPLLTFWALLSGMLSSFFIPQSAQGQVIRVLLIDPGNGHPVEGVRVWLYLGNPALPETPRLEERTARDGSANFHLPPPFPDQLFVYGEVEHTVGGCSPGLFETEHVIRGGGVADVTCDGGKWRAKWRGKLTPQPGEIIVFARKLKWWRRFQD